MKLESNDNKVKPDPDADPDPDPDVIAVAVQARGWDQRGVSRLISFSWGNRYP